MATINEIVKDAIEKALKDWGIDWILEERGTKFKGLMEEIELALKRVL